MRLIENDPVPINTKEIAHRLLGFLPPLLISNLSDFLPILGIRVRKLAHDLLITSDNNIQVPKNFNGDLAALLIVHDLGKRARVGMSANFIEPLIDHGGGNDDKRCLDTTASIFITQEGCLPCMQVSELSYQVPCYLQEDHHREFHRSIRVESSIGHLGAGGDKA